MIQDLSLSPRRKKISIFFLAPNQIFSVSGRLSPHNFEMYSVRPYQAYSFSLLVFQQLRSTLLLKMPFQAFCGISWHFLLHSPISIIYLLFFRSGGIAMLFFSPIISFCQRSCSFRAYPFNRSVVPFCSSSFLLIKPCISFLPECCLRSFLPLVPFIQ